MLFKLDDQSGHRRTKSILIVAQAVVFVEVIKNILPGDRLKEFSDDTNDVGGLIMRRDERIAYS